MLNLLTFTLSAGITALRVLRRGDNVLVVTNPPTIPFPVSLACRMRGARCTVLVHDVYPDAMIAAGMMSPDSALTALLSAVHRWLYRGVAGVIVLGRDMDALVTSARVRHAVPPPLFQTGRIQSNLRPTPREENALLRELGVSGKLVVQYSGNMGRTHGIECIARAARALQRHDAVHFLFIGSGAKRDWLDREIRRQELLNCTLLSPLAREELLLSLNACDIAVIAFMPGMSGVSVPSRMYNIMAVGKPMIAVADEDSELACVIAEEGIGWVVRPDDDDGLLAAIREAGRSPEALTAMGARARTAAVEKYSYPAVMRRYMAYFSSRLH